MATREKRPLGDLFGLTNFGVNLVRMPPGAISALRHAHAKQDEFVYILEGACTLVTDAGETPLRAAHSNTCFPTRQFESDLGRSVQLAVCG